MVSNCLDEALFASIFLQRHLKNDRKTLQSRSLPGLPGLWAKTEWQTSSNWTFFDRKTSKQLQNTKIAPQLSNVEFQRRKEKPQKHGILIVFLRRPLCRHFSVQKLLSPPCRTDQQSFFLECKVLCYGLRYGCTGWVASWLPFGRPQTASWKVVRILFLRFINFQNVLRPKIQFFN